MSKRTRVELLHLEGRIERWIRFGRIAEEEILDRRRRALWFEAGSYKFFKDGKVGVRGNMKLDRYHDELEFVNDLLVHVDKNDPTVVGKVLPRCVWPRVLQFFPRRSDRAALGLCESARANEERGLVAVYGR